MDKYDDQQIKELLMKAETQHKGFEILVKQIQRTVVLAGATYCIDARGCQRRAAECFHQSLERSGDFPR